MVTDVPLFSIMWNRCSLLVAFLPAIYIVNNIISGN